MVTVVGFAAARWRRAEDVLHLNEWGLGGRGFGTFVTWFLLGGDLYTAYTFIAVPALVFGTGAAGFFTLSYTIMVYPIVFVFLPRLWSVARVAATSPRRTSSAADGSRGLSLAVAFTGILAVMPYTPALVASRRWPDSGVKVPGLDETRPHATRTGRGARPVGRGLTAAAGAGPASPPGPAPARPRRSPRRRLFAQATSW